MAGVQTQLNDGGTNKRLRYSNYIEDIPGVNEYFLNRCYNAADTEVYRSKGRKKAMTSRQKYVTYIKALQKLARRICLDPGEKLLQRQITEITRTREFLGPAFFQHMGFHGVDIVSSQGVWTFTVSQDAEEVAERLDIFID